MAANNEFEFLGVNHLALVCKDMAKTVEFYRDILGMPLTKTIDLPQGRGQHFFFDIGNGDSLAFFWFPDAPEAAPGVSAPAALPTQGSFVSAHGSMNHIAINVRAEKFDEYYQRLIDKGHTYEQDGALWFRSTKFGDDKDRVLIRTNGVPTSTISRLSPASETSFTEILAFLLAFFRS